MVGIIMVGLIKPPVAIVFTVFGFIMTSLLELISIPSIALYAVVFIGLIILWEMKR